MSHQSATAALVGGVTLLERAMSYTLGSLHLVTAEALSRPTPCSQWDLRALLEHMDDSLVALCEAADVGQIETVRPQESTDPAASLITTLRNRACQLIEAWVAQEDATFVSVADRSLSSSIVAGTGAVEVAVHGWDVARACGYDRTIPDSLADEMLEVSSLLVADADRGVRFAYPVDVPACAEPGERLVAFLGRRP